MEMEPQTVTLDLSAPPVAAAPATPAVPAFTGEPGNFAKDMAALAAEAIPTPEPTHNAPIEPEQPATTTDAMAPVTVPDKFKDAEGNLDPTKLEKSQTAAEAEIARINKYLATQKELRQKQNEANGLKNQAPQVAPGPVQAGSFEAQLEADVKTFGLGPVLARLFDASKEAAKAETKREVLSDVNADREERRANKDRRELEDIARYDQEVLTPEGLDALARIRAERPYLETLANPTSEAYDIYLAEKVKKARQTGQVLPTPKGLTAKAPPTPVGPAPRAVVQSAPKLETKEQIDAHLNGLDLAGQAKFFKERGLRF
jgi:hypothetical protein